MTNEKAMNAGQFLRDVASHGMTVKLDNGLYRHLLFRAATDSWCMWFEIVTWPGSLAIHGDMGTWEFSRTQDMFGFFRNRELTINASYWHEKISSESRFGGPAKKFDAAVYRSSVISALDNYELTDPEKAEIVAALEEEVFQEEDESTARRALCDFKHHDFRFTDEWEINGQGYSYHFLWCLHAIVWAIQQYDAARSPAAPTVLSA